ncbi:PTS fructose transporter subunit IIC [Halosimplex aquaticum]|uniref:PTS fructose transporter subunit IIC n=1 Tax=Halosimplex aquaticum TaxID=3026162 RepID=A0ABD5Y6I5_9EURY|nr:PTS fructose transporter subunit IIC [Halosimplex aquaticum]
MRKNAVEADSIHRVRADLMTGVTYMIPFVTIGGVFLAVGYTLGDSTSVGGDVGTIPWYLVTVGSIALSAMVPILGGFVAYGIADRPGLAPGFMLTALIQDPRLVQALGAVLGVDTGDAHAGYIGALIVGLLAGVATEWAKDREPPALLEPLVPVLILPVSVTAALAPVVLALSVPIALASSIFEAFLRNADPAALVAVGTVLGGMMAVDMGGPVNKVAYVFAIGRLPELVFEPMAAVMLGGMVPPLGLAAAYALVPHRFAVDRSDARAAVLSSMAFVTEGAVPFTARNSRLRPPCVLGSAIAGGAAMGLGITMPAPHGGLLVVPLANDPALFVGCLLFGTVATTLTAAGVVLVGTGRTVDRNAVSETE